MLGIMSIDNDSWPSYDDSLTIDDTITIALAVNGKLRATEEVSKGLSKEELENIDKDDEKKVAMELAKKKLTSIKKSENDKYKISGKLYRFLISKGYNYDIVKETVKDVMSLDDFD